MLRGGHKKENSPNHTTINKSITKRDFGIALNTTLGKFSELKQSRVAECSRFVVFLSAISAKK